MKLFSLVRHRFVRIYQSYFPKLLTESEHRFIKESLTSELQALFYSQPLCDQRHGLLVFNKCLELFQNEPTKPMDQELLIASCFHDVAKKDCRFSVTQRVIVATALIFIPVKKHVKLRNSKSKFLRRIGVYVDHAELSWNILEKYTQSQFVKESTIFHHGIGQGMEPSEDQVRNLELFVIADTL